MVEMWWWAMLLRVRVGVVARSLSNIVDVSEGMPLLGVV
jgi:hypothetical protein